MFLFETRKRSQSIDFSAYWGVGHLRSTARHSPKERKGGHSHQMLLTLYSHLFTALLRILPPVESLVRLRYRYSLSDSCSCARRLSVQRASGSDAGGLGCRGSGLRPGPARRAGLARAPRFFSPKPSEA